MYTSTYVHRFIAGDGRGWRTGGGGEAGQALCTPRLIRPAHTSEWPCSCVPAMVEGAAGRQHGMAAAR